MPVQRTIFGQPVRLRMPPRRFLLLIALVVFLTVSLSLFGPPSSADLPTYDSVAEAVKNPHLPNLPNLPKVPDLPDLPDLPSLPNLPNLPKVPDLPKVPNPFGPAAHKPPAQPDSSSSSSYGPIQWMYDFKWRNPFSSSVTLDENTAVLPPLKERAPIYTFYEASAKQAKELSEAENRLLLAWRRAWWAQGFRPQVLSRAEAMKHPQYDLVQRLKLDKVDSGVEADVMRWLAWAQMGGGILAHRFALPMAEYDNPILSFLRKQEYPELSRIASLQDGLFFGPGAAVDGAIKKVIESPLFKNVTKNHDKIVALNKDSGAMINLLGKDLKVEPKSRGIAYYSASNINDIYGSLADKLTNSTLVEGLDLLAELINSHLHLTFQNTFSEGVAIVKPLPEHTTALMYETIDIGRNLTQCPSSPIPKSCPPNKPKCSPCDPAKPMKLQLLRAMKDTSALYTIGTVPHPYTLTSLHYTRDSVDENFLKQNADHDQWVKALTKDLLAGDRSAGDRVVYFKEVVASPQSASNSLWLTAERVSHADLDWIFGFNLPRAASPKAEPVSPDDTSDLVIFPRPEPPAPLEGVEVPEERYIRNEEDRLEKARDALKSTDKHWQGVVSTVEKWNPADTEAWRFARAFSARRRQERKKWEEEEQKFAGSEKKSGVHSGGEGKSRWIDKIKI